MTTKTNSKDEINRSQLLPEIPVRWKWMAGSTAIGTAAAATSAHAATVQITQTDNRVSTTGINTWSNDFTGDAMADASIVANASAFTYGGYIYNRADLFNPAAGTAGTFTAYAGRAIRTGGGGPTNFFVLVGTMLSFGPTSTGPISRPRLIPVTFTDARINSGAATMGFLEIQAFNTVAVDGTVEAVRLVFDDTSTTAPGGVVTGGSDTEWVAPLAPEVDVQGDGLSIPAGDVTPTADDGTDFGNRNILSGGIVRTFRVRNTGTATLTVTSTASDSGEFAVSPLAGPIADGAFEDITVTFDPTAAGVKNATITVNSDDADEAVYTFAVTGVGTVTPTATGPDNSALEASLLKKIKKLAKKAKVAKKKGQSGKAKKLSKNVKKLKKKLKALG